MRGRGQTEKGTTDILYGDIGPRSGDSQVPIVLAGAYQELIDRSVHHVSVVYQGVDDISEYPLMDFFDADGNNINDQVPLGISDKLEAILDEQLEKQASGWNEGNECAGQIEIDVLNQTSSFDHSYLSEGQDAAPFKISLSDAAGSGLGSGLHGWTPERVAGLIEALAEAEVDKAHISYSGVGDEGAIDEVRLIRIADEEERPIIKSDLTALEIQLGDLTETMLGSWLGNWGDGAGSLGTATLDVAAAEVDFDHYENTREETDEPFSVGALEWVD